MKKFLCALVLCISGAAEATMHPTTGLTEDGNHEVAERFAAFEQTNSGCLSLQDSPRVILTGFGLFTGLKYNVSGAVVDNMADLSFWPNSREPDTPSRGAPTANSLSDGVLKVSDRGARIFNRSFRIHDQNVSVCLIDLDVAWDFAAAVIVKEMERFQPALVIMTGVGADKAAVEAGSLNVAYEFPGFYADGSQDNWNLPQSSAILPDETVGSAVAMTWDTKRTGEAIQPLLKAMNVQLAIKDQADTSNEYICNNVSYVALQAAAHHRLELAGGSLILEPNITSNPKIGFFHYPISATSGDLDSKKITGWAKVLLTMIETNL